MRTLFSMIKHRVYYFLIKNSFIKLKAEALTHEMVISNPKFMGLASKYPDYKVRCKLIDLLAGRQDARDLALLLNMIDDPVLPVGAKAIFTIEAICDKLDIQLDTNILSIINNRKSAIAIEHKKEKAILKKLYDQRGERFKVLTKISRASSNTGQTNSIDSSGYWDWEFPYFGPGYGGGEGGDF